MYRFMRLSELNDATTDQVTQAAHELLKAMETDPIWQADPPVEFQVAQTYNKRRIHADEVPALVEKGLRDETDHQFDWDGETEETKSDERNYAAHLQVAAADLLVGAAGQLKKPQVAANAVKNLDTLAPEKPEDRSELWAVKGKFAELEGRKLDALLMYQASLKSRAADYVAKKPDEVAANEARLWNDLGGTWAALALWQNKPRQTEVLSESAWKVPSKPMSAWELSDLQGNIWKMQTLKGKTVLIDVWSTWCGYCLAELPEFQKIYEQMKGRTDVQVISFNIDDETGKVEPFIKEHSYTFPVLMARDYVTDLLGDVGILQAWIVDSTGKWGWEQMGFNPEKGHWLESVMEKTASVGKASGAAK
jgi:thiol-disulfide isomerase/thioredoxin